MNATILPNGKVLAVGGSTNNEDAGDSEPERRLVRPGHEHLQFGGSQRSIRASIIPRSLLLPDATVLLIGGNPSAGTTKRDMEIYSPAYLFNADGSPAFRPTITGVPPGPVGYGDTFQVQTPDAANITSVVLVRPGAPTHAFDMDQRLVGLSFTPGSGVLNVTAPPNGNIAPPGYYMLFMLDSAGVPSVARFVQLSTSVANQAADGHDYQPGGQRHRQPGRVGLLRRNR